MTAAPAVLTNCAVYHGAYDLTAQANSVTVATEVEELDGTTFADGGYKHPYAGLKGGTITYEGFADFTNDSDTALLAGVSSTGNVVTVGYDSVIGSRAWHGKGASSTFAPLEGAVGQLAVLHGNINTSGTSYGLRSGQIIAPKAARAGTASTVGQQLLTTGTVTTLTATLHVFSGSGSTVVTVASSATLGGSYTTRGTFTTVTGATSEHILVTGLSTTDQFWRATFTVGSGTTTAAVSAAVTL